MFAGLLDVKVSREEARRDRATIERVLAQLPESALAVDALGMVGSVQRSTGLAQALRALSAKQADLRTLRAHYTGASPAVRRLAAGVAALERQTIPAVGGALAAELRAREQQVGEGVDVASANLRKIPPLAVEGTRLQRGVTLAEQVVVNLQQRYEEARLADVSSLSDVRVLDRAVVPQTPGGSLGSIFVFLALVGGLGLGVAGAVLLDYGDRHVHHPDQVTQRMGLAILGAVPHVDWHNGKREESAGQVIEALRGIRLSVANRHGGDGPVVVTVTSPGRSDGKSFVASNLALAFADAGFRTLLIDGDVRRGRLHHVLNRHRRPGLTEILAGVVPLEQAVQGTSTRNLSFISCGARSHAGPALLSSAAMVQLVGQLRGQFGAIIVDSAPLGATVRDQRGQRRSRPGDELRGIAQGRAEVGVDRVARAYPEHLGAGQLGGGLEETLRQLQRGGRVGVGREHRQLAPPHPPDRIRAAPHRPEDAPQRLDRGIDVRRRIGCEHHAGQRGPAPVHRARLLPRAALYA